MEVRNRFKGLDLIDRVPDELWMEIRDIVQETSPWKRNTKKQNGCLTRPLAVKRREVKSKGEKERYKHLNAEFISITTQFTHNYKYITLSLEPPNTTLQSNFSPIKNKKIN